MSKKKFELNKIEFGSKKLFLIAGPCVIEDQDLMMEVAEGLVKICDDIDVPLIFKSSFTKDNRSSLDHYEGPGLKKGLQQLKKIKETFNIPIISDIHTPDQAKIAAEVLDIIQIPAYLCMQTSLLRAVASTKKIVNLKHGQFLAPENMIKPVKKLEGSGTKKIILTERGYTFGYNDLVVDPRSFYHLRETNYPVVFDITHSVRRYGIPSSDPKGSSREYLNVLARASVAAGVDGLFIEVHKNPPVAKCDASSQMYLKDLKEFLKPLLEIHELVS